MNAARWVPRMNDSQKQVAELWTEAFNVSAATTVGGSFKTCCFASLPLTPIARTGALPLSITQQRFWFLSKLEGPSFAFNEMLVMRLRGPLHQDALVGGLQAIVARHEVLRTRLGETDGSPIQIVDPPESFVVRQQRTHSTDGLSVLINQEFNDPFDLGRDALFRVLLIEEGADHVLVFKLHQSITDRWSWGVLMMELHELYSA